MQIKDLDMGSELKGAEQSAVVGGVNSVTGFNLADFDLADVNQSGNSGSSFASPVINNVVQVPLAVQVNTGVNLDQSLESVVALLGSAT
jgi:hypothetical protein